jgi:CRP/FNR family transcriptional regulator, cyclic AMP receptor protein
MVQRPMGVVEPLPLVVVRAGAVPVRQGEPCHGIWGIESGVMRVSMVTAEGRELVLDVIGRGDPVGLPRHGVSPCTVRALGPSRLRPLDRDEAAALLIRRDARLTAFAAELAWLEVPARVDRRLRDLAMRFGRKVRGGTSVPFALTHDELAAMVGTSRESVSRAIRRLLDEGRIAVPRRGRYVVRDQLQLITR